MSAGATIKLTNSSGKAIQLTNTSNMTYSGNVLSITCNSFRDENAVGIIIQFYRVGSYSRPFITKIYQ